MDLHTPHQTPDWQNTDRINTWQRLAIITNGVATIGNLLSVSGLVVVAWAAIALYRRDFALGLSLAAVGRLADLADGYAANKTHTKSRLGEIVDTTCDKLGVLCIALAALFAHILPLYIVALITVYHVYSALFGVVWGRRYQLHTNRFGKFAMFESWLVIFAFLIYTRVPNRAILVVSVLCLTAFVITALAAMYSYWQDLQKASAKRLQLAPWAQDIAGIVHIYNPQASSYPWADRLLQALCNELNCSPKRFNILRQKDELASYLHTHSSGPPLLITIAGGDGTVSSVVNLVIELTAKEKGPTVYLLPLWGGNANDFAYMLNGLRTSIRPRRLLATSNPISIPLIKVVLSSPSHTRTMYACCYASFGASAFATRRLNAQRFSKQSTIRWFPPLLLLRELFFVVRAFLDSPLNVAEINDQETSFYEHILINGSRIAKVNRVPVQINEPAFFHAFVQRKHPSIIITIMRILLGRPDTVYAKKTHLHFKTKFKMDTQIDGEVLSLDANTSVSASVAHAPFITFVTTRIAP